MLVKMTRILKESLWFYTSVFLALCFIAVSLILSPKRYNSLEEWQSANNKAKPILESMGEGSLGTFSPPSTDRNFWDSIENKPMQIPPPPPEGVLGNALNEQAIIREGTKQECFYPDGTWIPEIEKAIKRLLDQESILNKPWHNTELFKVPLVGLETTETGVVLANCIGLIGHELEPTLVEEIKRTLRKRIIDPYKKDLQLAQHKKMMFGFDNCPWIGNPGNWNAVCTANIIYISMVILEDKAEIADIVARSKENITTYLKSFEEDGYLSEGIRYWNYGFSHFLLLSECLLKITNGRVNLYENPKIKPIAEFPLKAIIGENKALGLEYYPIFTDNNNPIRGGKDILQWYILSKRTKLPFTVPPIKKNNYTDAEFDLLYNMPKTLDTYQPIEIELPTGPTYFKSAGVLISRWANNNEVLAIKGGSNSEDHNHNDIGSYTLFTKGKHSEMLPVTGDLGDIEYTSENIGTNRYQFDLLSSYGHPVPSVDNQLQNNHPKARGKVLLAKVDKNEDKIVYDLTDAYSVKGLKELKRSATSRKKGEESLIIEDSFRSTRPIEFETPLIVPGKPTQLDNNKLLMEIKGTTFIFEVQASRDFEIKISALDNTGYKFTTRGSPKELGDPHRVSIRLSSKGTEGKISYRVYKVNQTNQPIVDKAIPPPKPEDAEEASGSGTQPNPIKQREEEEGRQTPKLRLWEQADEPNLPQLEGLKDFGDISFPTSKPTSIKTPSIFPSKQKGVTLTPQPQTWEPVNTETNTTHTPNTPTNIWGDGEIP